MARITESAADDRIAGGRRNIDASTVAKLPAPGTVVPGAFAFTPDGKAVTYLKAESASLSRVLWRAEVAGGPPRVIARPPGLGRHRRQRLEGGGPPPRAAAAPRHRDHPGRPRREGRRRRHPAQRRPLRPPGADGPLERLTETPAPEIDPQLDRRRVEGRLRPRRRAVRPRPGHQEGDPAHHGGGRGPDARPGRVHGPGGDGPVHRLLVVARRVEDRLPGDRRAAHPALLDRPPGRRRRLGRDPPLPVRRARPTPRSGSASIPAVGRRDPLARPRRARTTTSTSPGSTGTAPRACSSRSSRATRSR